jgi:hypothetical protein
LPEEVAEVEVVEVVEVVELEEVVEVVEVSKVAEWAACVAVCVVVAEEEEKAKEKAKEEDGVHLKHYQQQQYAPRYYLEGVLQYCLYLHDSPQQPRLLHFERKNEDPIGQFRLLHLCPDGQALLYKTCFVTAAVSLIRSNAIPIAS